jgi:predicted RNA-binding Zn-ribbon protein involved in translation (DUF1610 family)
MKKWRNLLTQTLVRLPTFVKTVEKSFFVGLSGVKHNCPACGGKLLVRELTRADTHREKDERSM